MERVVIVGASLAGFTAARELRKHDFAGSITIIGAEEHLPYDRPPLSKDFLAGKSDAAKLALPGVAAADELELTWRLGCAAERLDLNERSITLADGTAESFDRLVIATGATPRRLDSGHELGGVHVLRTRDDAVAIKAALSAGPRRVVVIGAGFIGAEVAATCRSLDLTVTLIEAAPVPMERGLGARIGAVCGDLHVAHGVDLRLGVAVAGLEGDQGGNVERVHLSDDTSIDTDLVVVGIGVVPETDWLAGSGLTIDDGVVCDDTMLAAPGVVAAGDVARWPNRLFDEIMRVEHWENAMDQGAAAARRLLVPDGEPGESFTPVPWFWSDQYDRKIQLAGRVRSTDRVAIVNGTVEEGRFVALYGREDRLTGVFGMNRPRHVMQTRTRIADGADFDSTVATMRAS